MSSTSNPLYWRRLDGHLSPMIETDIIMGNVSGGTWFDGHGEPVDIPEAHIGDYYLDVDSCRVYKFS